MMSNVSLGFDHVHLVSKDPQATVRWYVDKFGGKVIRDLVMYGAPQISVVLGTAMLIVRGQRPAELAMEKPGLQWGVDHFGLHVNGDFDGFCAELRSKGVAFTRMDPAFARLDPTEPKSMIRVANIQAPDGVKVELLQRNDQP
ncbi:MAG: VOC family protein [Betaproteobacteria bacterium]|nr:VOC family protein [Betaproteobacteria bacterium]